MEECVASWGGVGRRLGVVNFHEDALMSLVLRRWSSSKYIFPSEISLI